MLPPADSGIPQLDELSQSVYDEIHALASRYMQRERPGLTLQATALVNEVYLKLHGRGARWESHAHFVRTFAQAMRHYLIDQARRRRVRGNRIYLDPEKLDKMARSEVLPLDEGIALAGLIEKLSEQRPRAAQVLELHVFGGLTLTEIGEQLGVDPRTAKRDWAGSLVWLRRYLEDGPS